MPNAKTHTAATVRDALPLGQITLIGTLTGTDAPRALMRTGGGAVRTLDIGDRISGHVVAAIEESRVVLARGADTQVLGIASHKSRDEREAAAA